MGFELELFEDGEAKASGIQNGVTAGSLDYRSVIDGTSEGFALLDHNFTILDVNTETLRLESRGREQLVGRSHWEAYPGSETSELGALYKKAVRERVPVNLEHRHIWEDGRVSWLDMRAYPVSNGRLAIFFRDETERHQAERKVRESEERFRAAIEAFTDALWTNDAEGKMSGEQPGWAALTGQSYEEYQGYGWSDAVHPDDAQPTIKAWEAAVAAQAPFEFEHRVKTRDGQWRLFAIKAVPLLSEDGTVREWVGVHRDVTSVTEANVQLARNAETFEALVRSNPFGIYVVDHNFRMLHASKGCERVFSGIEPLIGRNFAEIMEILWQPPFATDAIGRFRHTLETGETYISHSTIEPRNNISGTEAYDWRIDRITLPDGQFGVVCYFYDLSERVELEASLRKALDDKDMLVREIDHRVRNSLSIVSALLVMHGGASNHPEVKQALSVAAARMHAVARIHERLYKGKQVGVVQFDEYLSEICKDLRASLGRDGVDLKLDVVPLQLSVDDAIPLGLVTNELVTNAFKYCRGDGIVISVSLVVEGATFALIVEDNGEGMPAGFVAGATDGLGLEVVDLLARQVGASIEFPKAKEPARFKVLMPVSHIINHTE